MEFFEKFKVAGLFVGDRKKNVMRYVTNRSKFLLEREPDNEHDKNAVLVKLPVRGGQYALDIGYVPRDLAARIAPFMDDGSDFCATFRTKIMNEKNGTLIDLWLNLNSLN